MNCYLIRFQYQHYCQGYETATETVLVHAINFDTACDKIRAQNIKYESATNFENLTVF